MESNFQSLKFVIYGNCQASALAKTLLTSTIFAKIYTYIPTKAVHEITEDEMVKLYEILPNIDLFIFVKVNIEYKGIKYSTDYLCSLLKKDCIIMSFPCCYFSAYCPEIKYALIDNKRLVCPTEMHDHKFIEYYLKNIDTKISFDDYVKEYKQLYLFNKKLYTKEYLTNIVQNNIKELKKREDETTVNPLYISKYINDNYKYKQLFTTYNHPTYYLFNHIANQVLKYLNVNDVINCTTNFLSWKPFIYMSVYVHLELRFEISYDYCIVGNNKFNIEQFIKYYYDEYKKISDINKIKSITW